MATRSSSRQSSGSGVAVVITAILAFLLAGSVGFLIWQMLGLRQEFDKVKGKCPEVQDVRKLYPGYFRTSSEQEIVQRMRLSNINNTYTFSPTSCKFECKPQMTTTTTKSTTAATSTPAPNTRWTTYQPLPIFNSSLSRQKRDDPFSDFVFHSCCTSGRRYTSPDSALNLVGVRRQLVQESAYKQYFLEESCEQYPSCSGCMCAQPEPYMYEAVVFKDKHADSADDKFEVDFIQLPGCCKCLNLGLA